MFSITYTDSEIKIINELLIYLTLTIIIRELYTLECYYVILIK